MTSSVALRDSSGEKNQVIVLAEVDVRFLLVVLQEEKCTQQLNSIWICLLSEPLNYVISSEQCHFEDQYDIVFMQKIHRCDRIWNLWIMLL